MGSASQAATAARHRDDSPAHPDLPQVFTTAGSCLLASAASTRRDGRRRRRLVFVRRGRRGTSSSSPSGRGPRQLAVKGRASPGCDWARIVAAHHLGRRGRCQARPVLRSAGGRGFGLLELPWTQGASVLRLMPIRGPVTAGHIPAAVADRHLHPASSVNFTALETRL